MSKFKAVGFFAGVFLFSFILMGCDQLKGPKGDTGSSGLIGTKTYTGVPLSNPYNVYCSEISDTSKQIIDVYATFGTELMRLPFSTAAEAHLYSIDGTKVSFATVYTTGSQPTTALRLVEGTQAGYRIEIKTFASAPAKASYIRAQQRAQNKGSTADYINNILQW